MATIRINRNGSWDARIDPADNLKDLLSLLWLGIWGDVRERIWGRRSLVDNIRFMLRSGARVEWVSPNERGVIVFESEADLDRTLSDAGSSASPAEG